MKKIIGGIVALALAAVMIGFGTKYYHDTYQGQAAYMIVTETPKKVATKDNNGQVQAGLYSYNYHCDWVLADGTHRSMTYEVSGEAPQPLQVGKYVKAQISQKRVVSGPSYVTLDTIPNKAQQALKK